MPGYRKSGGRIPYAQYKSLPKSAQNAIKKASKTGNMSAKTSRTQYPNVRNLLNSLAGITTSNYKKQYNLPDSIAQPVSGIIGSGIDYLTGFGDYTLNIRNPQSNSIMDDIIKYGPPVLMSTNNRSHIVRHREYIGDVITGGANTFNINHYSINPGLKDTFPWLANIALSFEQYRINGLVFEFKSTSADALNSTNTALGTVILATDYNADSPVFVNKQQMENSEFSSSAKQSCSVLHPIECKRSMTPVSELYIRDGPVPTGQDLRLYDLGRFSIATSGQQGAQVTIGELWCTYEVEFMKPVQADPTLLTYHAYSNDSVDVTNFFGDIVRSVDTASTLNMTIIGNQLQFPSRLYTGSYLVAIGWRGTSPGLTTACLLPTINTSNCDVFEMWGGTTNNTELYAGQVNNSVALTTVFVVDITGLNSFIELSTPSVLPFSVCEVDVYVTQVNGNVNRSL